MEWIKKLFLVTCLVCTGMVVDAGNARAQGESEECFVEMVQPEHDEQVPTIGGWLGRMIWGNEYYDSQIRKEIYTALQAGDINRAMGFLRKYPNLSLNDEVSFRSSFINHNGYTGNRAYRDTFFGRDALCTAINRNNYGVAEILVSRGLKIEAEHYLAVARNGNCRMFQLLEQYSKDRLKYCVYPRVLEKAFKGKHLELFQLVSDRVGSLSYVEKLSEAICRKSFDDATFLVSGGVRIAKEHYILASQSGAASLLEVFESNASDEVKADSYSDAMAMGAKSGHQNVVEFLFPKTLRSERPLALRKAAESGHTQIITWLIQHGVKPFDCGLLHAAVRSGNPQAVEVVLKENISVDELENGVTPLEVAINLGQADIVELLSRSGADVRKIKSTTPLQKAAMRGHAEIVRIFA